MYDIIVVGGGPAGMTAALYARRNNKTVLVIEKNGFGGQITYSPKVENYPGIKQMAGTEFADWALEQIMDQGAEVELECVIEIRDEGAVKKVITEEGSEFEAKAVIIATGVKHRMLGLEGEYELVGNGISFCAVCDGEFYRGKDVVVIGGGNSALQEAVLLSENCTKVTMVQDMDYFTGEEKLQEILFSKQNVEKYTGMTVEGFITESGELKGVKVRSKVTGEVSDIMCDGVFVAIGLIPENEAFRNVAELNSYGYIDSGEDCLTVTPGIFCAGDCRSKSVRQLTTAAADGSVSAVAACRYIDAM